MAISHQEQEQEQNPCSIFDELYCEEENLENDEEINENNQNNNNNIIFFLPFCEDDNNEELKCLFNKEKQGVIFKDVSLITARKEVVNWMLKVNLYYGFSGLTSILSVNYFDRCISSMKLFNHGKKCWTFQLLAVACISLAAKVEETHVPLILDLQVEGASPIFEPKDIQKMELLVLSTLEWKMHPITPFSFLDHIIRRLGLSNHLHWEFLKKCEEVLLSLLFDWRFMSYLPSVLATSTMMHVIDQIESSNSLEFHTRLLNVLNLCKEKVNECYELIIETLSGSTQTNIPKSKRRFDQMMTNDLNTIIPTSPNGVLDTFYFSSDSSNDSWAATSGGGRLSISSSASSSPVVNGKKVRVHVPLQLPSLSRVFAEVVESPR